MTESCHYCGDDAKLHFVFISVEHQHYVCNSCDPVHDDEPIPGSGLCRADYEPEYEPELERQ